MENQEAISILSRPKPNKIRSFQYYLMPQHVKRDLSTIKPFLLMLIRIQTLVQWCTTPCLPLRIRLRIWTKLRKIDWVLSTFIRVKMNLRNASGIESLEKGTTSQGIAKVYQVSIIYTQSTLKPAELCFTRKAFSSRTNIIFVKCHIIARITTYRFIVWETSMTWAILQTVEHWSFQSVPKLSVL